MQDTPRVLTDVVIIALLIMLMSGCVSTPSRYRERNGDFIMNIGARDKDSPVPAAVASRATPSAPSGGRAI